MPINANGIEGGVRFGLEEGTKIRFPGQDITPVGKGAAKPTTGIEDAAVRPPTVADTAALGAVVLGLFEAARRHRLQPLDPIGCRRMG